jgi:hypothetical protein
VTALGKGEKAARAAALTAARAGLKGLGANETAGGSARQVRTASTKAVRKAGSGGIYVRKLRLRKIRLRGSRPSNF